jgi:hypothetical protein
MTSILISICVGVLEKLIMDGTNAAIKLAELKAEIAKLDQAASDYQKVVTKPGVTRQERMDAENNTINN